MSRLQCTRGKFLYFGIIGMVVLTAGVVILHYPHTGEERVLAHLKSTTGDRTMIVAKYGGFLEGWNIGLVVISSMDGKILAYYVAHEAALWRDVRFEETQQELKIWKGDKHIGSYYTSTGDFYHNTQDHVYPRIDAIVDKENSWW